MAKHFIINPYSNPSSKEDILEVEEIKTKKIKETWQKRELKSKEKLVQVCPLKHTYGRVIIKVDLQLKNYTTFSDGSKIRLERQFNNLNRRETEPVQGIVISAEYIPIDSEILISHNALHDSNRIFGYGSGSSDVQYFSIPEYECFAWRNKDGELNPMKHFDFALRVFKPYEGMILGMPPTLIKDTLYVTSGKLKGNVVKTLKGCDYVIIYQGQDGKEAQIIRFRPFGDPETKREEEAIAILNDLTDLVNNGKLKIGITEKDCELFHKSHTLNKI